MNGNRQQAVQLDVSPFSNGHHYVAEDFAQLLQRLSRGLNKADIKQREGWRDRQGQMHFVDYVEWQTVADLLDRLIPDWSHAVRDIMQVGNFVAVTVALTLNGVTREGVGTGAADSETGIKKAEHDASNAPLSNSALRAISIAMTKNKTSRFHHHLPLPSIRWRKHAAR